MVKIYRHDAVSNGVTYSAVLNDFENGQASEVILKSEPMGMRVMHEADFPTSLLGKASRDSYVRSILQSFVYQVLRDYKKV
jgi:hypothetical protein|tara:strand:- start:52 stop:294 length:243 start_codon:yes stop_codon:yes gene_type:complete